MYDNYVDEHEQFAGLLPLRKFEQPRTYIFHDLADYFDNQFLLRPSEKMILGGRDNHLAGKYALVAFEKPLRFNLCLDAEHHYEVSDFSGSVPVSLEPVHFTPSLCTGLAPELFAQLQMMGQAHLSSVLCLWRAHDRQLILNNFRFYEAGTMERFRGTGFELLDDIAYS